VGNRKEKRERKIRTCEERKQSLLYGDLRKPAPVRLNVFGNPDIDHYVTCQTRVALTLTTYESDARYNGRTL